MDKNTLSGLALMALVIFVFMWLNKPSQAEIDAQRQAAIEAAYNSNSNNQTATAAPLLSQDEIDRLIPTVKTYGSAQQDGTIRLTNDNVDLVYNAQADSAHAITGTVNAPGAKIDVRRVIAGDMLDYTPEQAYEARNVLASTIQRVNKYKSFAQFLGGDNQEVTLENDQMRVTFNSQGGMISKVVLKKYLTETTAEPTEIELFNDQTAAYDFTFNTAEQRINTADLNFRPVLQGDTAVVMSLPLAPGVEWNIRYALVPDYYLVKMDIEQQGMDAIVPPSTTTIDLNWRLKMIRHEIGRTFEERYSAIYYKFLGEGPEDLNANKNDSEKLTGSIKWVAFKNQFFSSVIIPRNCFSRADLQSTRIEKSETYLKDMTMLATMPYNNSTNLGFDFYFGPNDYPLLNKVDDLISAGGDDLDLNRLVPLGWGLFRWINQLIVIPVFTFLGKYITNYGIIILLLTIFIKILIFPFTYKSFVSQAKMRVLAPEIKEINDKYPGQENAMKRSQETMNLYSRAGASPMSGCLPMLLQMPILIAMFAFFPSAIELRGQSFLWAHDLSAPDSICTLPFSIPFYGKHVSLFCLLMTITNIIYSYINMQSQPANNTMPGMKWMMYLMPVMFLFFFNDYASGLSYYYFLSLLITILQTWIFRRVITEDKVRAHMAANAKKPRKKSGFMARLEAAQKQQEAQMRQQAKERARRNR